MKTKLITLVLSLVMFSGATVSACSQNNDWTPPEEPTVYVCPEGTVPTVDVPESIQDCKETAIEVPPVEVQPVVTPVVVAQPVVAPTPAPAPQPVFTPFTGK